VIAVTSSSTTTACSTRRIMKITNVPLHQAASAEEPGQEPGTPASVCGDR
jgi:hypothetical protein